MIWVHTEGQRCSYSIASKAIMQIMNRNAKFAVGLHANRLLIQQCWPFFGHFFNLKIPFYTWENEPHIWEKYHCSYAHNMKTPGISFFLKNLFYFTWSGSPPHGCRHFSYHVYLLSCNWPTNNHDYNNTFTLSKLSQLVLFTKYSK